MGEPRGAAFPKTAAHWRSPERASRLATRREAHSRYERADHIAPAEAGPGQRAGDCRSQGNRLANPFENAGSRGPAPRIATAIANLGSGYRFGNVKLKS